MAFYGNVFQFVSTSIIVVLFQSISQCVILICLVCCQYVAVNLFVRVCPFLECVSMCLRAWIYDTSAIALYPKYCNGKVRPWKWGHIQPAALWVYSEQRLTGWLSGWSAAQYSILASVGKLCHNPTMSHLHQHHITTSTVLPLTPNYHQRQHRTSTKYQHLTKNLTKLLTSKFT